MTSHHWDRFAILLALLTHWVRWGWNKWREAMMCDVKCSSVPIVKNMLFIHLFNIYLCLFVFYMCFICESVWGLLCKMKQIGWMEESNSKMPVFWLQLNSRQYTFDLLKQFRGELVMLSLFLNNKQCICECNYYWDGVFADLTTLQDSNLQIAKW